MTEKGSMTTDEMASPIHSHHLTWQGRDVVVKDGLYSAKTVCRLVVFGSSPAAQELEAELAGVICEYLEGKRRRSPE